MTDHPPHSYRRLAPLALCAAGAVAGCSAPETASVRLHNDAPNRVAARIVHTGAARETTPVRRVLGPGATATLGPVAIPERGELRLVLEPASRHDYILEAPVPAGLTAYHVDRPLGVARLDLEPAAINPWWTHANGFLSASQHEAIAMFEMNRGLQRRADAETLDFPEP
ncbi:MAG: hypothetical protein ACF8Q5_10555 [Phycisphaerales bacterium JB040]